MTWMPEDVLKMRLWSRSRPRGFQGLDIDFEYILAEDRDAFVDFVAYMQEAVAPSGIRPASPWHRRPSDTQTGLLYEGKDYRRLGETADYVLLMTYEWGYTYGPPMAVAPLNKVREVVEYAVTVIPPLPRSIWGFPTMDMTGRCPSSEAPPAPVPSAMWRPCNWPSPKALPSNLTISPSLLSSATGPTARSTKCGSKMSAA